MRITLAAICTAAVTLSEAGPFIHPTAAADPVLVSVERIWDAAPHNAFTDLVRFQDRFFCTFRESEDHVGGDGKLRLIVSDDGKSWKSAALLAEKGVDLRDPKLSITPDGRLMIVAGGSIYNGTTTLMGAQPRVAFSQDGSEWTPTTPVLADGQWLWRVTWRGDIAYGVAYKTRVAEGERLISLYKSTDGLDWSLVTKLELDGEPNETTLRFLKDGTMIALVRREAGDGVGRIGTSTAPFTDWKWAKTEYQLGGPDFIVLPNGELWAGTRIYPGGAKTALARMTTTSLEPVITLPSGGDTSYPGFVWHDDLLWMSYYSSHEGKTSIYLAKFRFE